jgi:hypothetical protein
MSSSKGEAVPVQFPLQPVKIAVAAAVAVGYAFVPFA